MKTKALSIIISILFSVNIYGQTRECEYCGEPYALDSIIVRDTIVIRDTVYISTLDSVTKYFGLTFNEYVERYLLFAKENDTVNSPSTDMVYLNHFLPMLENSIDEKRWIQDIFSIYAISGELSIKQTSLPFPDSIDRINSDIDILIKYEGSQSTDYFLKSQKLIDTCLVEIFQYVCNVNTSLPNKIQGINFYFPQFSFKEKRAMAQFAKSLSLIVDKFNSDDIKHLKLYFSFDKGDGQANINYLNCIASMVDTVMLVDNSDEQKVFANYLLITKGNSNIPLFHKIKNQFYLARLYIERYTSLTSNNELIKIAHSDYSENNWESYLLILCILIVISIVIFILYWTIPAFSYYLNKNSDYMILLVLILILEIILLSFTMIETMSKDSVFKFSEKNKNLFLLLPLVLIFLAPIVKIMRNKKRLP